MGSKLSQRAFESARTFIEAINTDLTAEQPPQLRLLGAYTYPYGRHVQSLTLEISARGRHHNVCGHIQHVVVLCRSQLDVQIMTDAACLQRSLLCGHKKVLSLPFISSPHGSCVGVGGLRFRLPHVDVASRGDTSTTNCVAQHCHLLGSTAFQPPSNCCVKYVSLHQEQTAHQSYHKAISQRVNAQNQLAPQSYEGISENAHTHTQRYYAFMGVYQVRMH